MHSVHSSRIKAFAAASLLALGLAGGRVSAGELPAEIDALRSALDEIRQRHGVAAMGVALVDRERALWVDGLGIADWETRRPVSGDSLFRIGSITKAFTGLAALLLVEDGRLELDERVDAYLDYPVFDNRWHAAHPVRIAQLLEHTAGLPDMTKKEWDFNEPVSLRAALDVDPSSRRLLWPPGMHSSYSNTGPGVAGLVIEARSEMSYEDFLRERLFEPLGMSATNLVLDARSARELVTGYDRDARSKIRYWHMLYRPFGAINTTPRDMTAFLRMLLNDGELDGRRILRVASLRRMEVPRTTLAAREGLDYGYGLGSYRWYRDGVLFQGHGGDGDGYLAHFAYSRDAGLAYFVVINAFRHDPLRAARGVLEDYIVSRAAPGEPPPVAAIDPRRLAQLTGEFETATARFRGRGGAAKLTVSLRGGNLFTQRGKADPKPLVAVTERWFRRPYQHGPTIAFIDGPDGALYLQGDLGNYRRALQRNRRQ